MHTRSQIRYTFNFCIFTCMCIIITMFCFVFFNKATLNTLGWAPQEWKTLGRGNPLTSRSGPGGGRLPGGRKHKRAPLQTRGEGRAIRAGAREHHRRNRKRGGTGSRHTGDRREGWTEATKLLGFLLLICLFLLLLRDLLVPPLAGGSRKPVISALSLNRVALLFHILLACELSLLTASHGDGAAPACLCCVPLFSTSVSIAILQSKYCKFASVFYCTLHITTLYFLRYRFIDTDPGILYFIG